MYYLNRRVRAADIETAETSVDTPSTITEIPETDVDKILDNFNTREITPTQFLFPNGPRIINQLKQCAGICSEFMSQESTHFTRLAQSVKLNGIWRKKATSAS